MFGNAEEGECTMRLNRLICASLTTAVLGVGSANAALIDFETSPSPQSDNADVMDQYNSQKFDNVTFSSGGDPAKLEAVGEGDGSPQGFLNDPIGTNDVSTSGIPGLGDWFLRSRGDILDRGKGDSFLQIEYGSSVFQASGQIWDIDGNDSQGSEKWIVRAFDTDGNELAMQTSPEFMNTSDTDSLNGQPWEFTFDLRQDGPAIAQLDFEFAGTKDRGIGLAFDNFNTSGTDIPTPATLGLLGIGLFGLGIVGYRRKTTASA
jgi:hypothetical protein